jgi:transketolase
MALANKLDKNDHRIYVLCGDGECQEGQLWEAVMSAAHFKLDNMCIIVDHNHLQIDGNTEDVMNVDPLDKKFEAFNCHVINVQDGHDFDELIAAYKEARTVKGKPTVIIAETVKGKGVSFMENNVGWHGVAPNEKEYKAAMEELEAAE